MEYLIFLLCFSGNPEDPFVVANNNNSSLNNNSFEDSSLESGKDNGGEGSEANKQRTRLVNFKEDHRIRYFHSPILWQQSVEARRLEQKRIESQLQPQPTYEAEEVDNPDEPPMPNLENDRYDTDNN